MNWKRLLAYISGSVDQELLLRNEYLVTENRILRNQIKGRLRHTDPERISLAEIGRRLGPKGRAEVAQIVRPETILGWHRQLMARKLDGSKVRSTPGRTPTVRVIEELVLQMTRENRTWGYQRIVGAMGNLGHVVSHQTVANLLKAAWVGPGPGTRKADAVEGVYPLASGNAGVRGFFHRGGLDGCGLMTTTVLVFMRIAPSQIHIAGISLAPTRGVDEAAGSQRDDGWRWLPEPLSKFTARPRDQI